MTVSAIRSDDSVEVRWSVDSQVLAFLEAEAAESPYRDERCAADIVERVILRGLRALSEDDWRALPVVTRVRYRIAGWLERWR